MKPAKHSELKLRGWRVGSVAEFLGLTPDEEALIEIKLALSRSLKRRRESVMTLAELAEKLDATEPKLAKAESGDVSVPMELLVRAMLTTGATAQDIGKAIAKTNRRLAVMSH